MRFFSVHHALAAVLSLPAIAGFNGHAAAAKYKVLYEFCSQANCADGENPSVGLTGDASGNLYGITNTGGANGFGTIFKLAKSGKTYSYQVLHDIAPCNESGCPDGWIAGGAMVVDTTGNLFGTMLSGGTNPFGASGHGGTVFKVSPAGNYQVLYNFCSSGGCSDGDRPNSPVTYTGANTGAPYNGTSLLYGATESGGANGNGTAFSITAAGVRATLSNMCRFTEHDDCRVGAAPTGSVAVDSSGAMYGANREGEALNPDGLIWRVTNKTGALHDFCTTPPDCKDGYDPFSGVFLDPASPKLFGTAFSGGKGGHGVAYQIDIGTKKETILHQFCVSGAQPCKDGDQVNSTLYPDGAGGVLGVTSLGGKNAGGILYRIDLATNKLATLHTFCLQTNCEDGSDPVGQLVQSGGSIFGATTTGGLEGFHGGVIYQATP